MLNEKLHSKAMQLNEVVVLIYGKWLVLLNAKELIKTQKDINYVAKKTRKL